MDNSDNCFRMYNFSFNRYSASINVPRVEKCNGFTCTNIGDTVAQVNGKLLFPSATPATILGDSRSWGGNEGEVYVGNIEVIFVAPLGAAPLLEVEQKFYI